MEEILNELIEVIKFSNQRSFWDYLFAITPIVASIIAIVISVRTAKMQNKIALFDLRYKVISLLNFLLSTSNSVIMYDGADRSLPLKNAMNAYYSVSENLNDNTNDNCNYSGFYTGLILELAKVECLFKNENVESVIRFLETFEKYVLKVAAKASCVKERQELEETIMILIDNKIIDKLNKYIRL